MTIDAGQMLEAAPEEGVRPGEPTYLELFDQAHDGLLVTSMDEHIIEVNNAAHEIFGYTRDEMLALPARALYADPADREPLVDVLVERGTINDHETRLRAKDGSLRICIVNSRARHDVRGEVIGFRTVVHDITEQRAAEAALRSAAGYTRRLIEASIDPLVTISPAGKITDVNRATEQATGQPRERLIGTDFAEYFTSPENARAAYQQALRDGELRNCPLTMRRSDGELIEVLYNATVYRAESGELEGVFAAARDVTEANRVALALQRSESLLRQTQEVANVGGWEYDIVSKTMTWTEQVYKIHELPLAFRPDSPERTADFFAPGDRERAAAAMRAAMSAGEAFDLELQLLAGSGKLKIVRAVGCADKSNGKVTRVFGAIADITERKEAEREVRRRASQYATMLATTDDGFWVVDPTGRLLDVNDAYCRMSGYSRAELLGLRVTDIDASMNPVMVAERIRRCAESGHARFETRHRSKTGNIFDVEITVSFWREMNQFLLFARDITERKAADEDLRSTNQFLDTVITASPMAIHASDLERHVLLWNAAAERLYGWTRQEMEGQDLGLTVPEDTRAEFDDMREAATRGGIVAPVEGWRLRKDGSRFPVSSCFGPINDAAGKAIGVIGVSQDISARKQAESQLLHLNEELEQRVHERTMSLEATNQELQSFAYSVSHDLRAPLRAMDGFSQALLEDFGPTASDTARDYLGRIRKASQQMGGLIDDLLSLSRLTRGQMKVGPCDLAKLAEEVVADLQQAEPARKVEVTIHEPLVADADARLVRIVLENLIGNAWKFTSRAHAPKIEIGALTRGEVPTFYVRDNGAGFDMQYADKLFRPFQRLHSKADFEGNGIGLATVQRIIHRHGGTVSAEAAVGQGATFYFTLTGDAA